MVRTSWYKVPFIGHHSWQLTTAPMELTAWDMLTTAGLIQQVLRDEHTIAHHLPPG